MNGIEYFYFIINNSVPVWCHDSFRAKNWTQTYTTSDRPYIKVILYLPQVKNTLSLNDVDKVYVIIYQYIVWTTVCAIKVVVFGMHSAIGGAGIQLAERMQLFHSINPYTVSVLYTQFISHFLSPVTLFRQYFCN